MSDSSESKATPNIPGTNPNTASRDGEINPSAPSVGTEQWGNSSDERKVLSGNHPSHTRAGQMKGNPGDSQAEASNKAEYEAENN